MLRIVGDERLREILDRFFELAKKHGVYVAIDESDVVLAREYFSGVELVLRNGIILRADEEGVSADHVAVCYC